MPDWPKGTAEFPGDPESALALQFLDPGKVLAAGYCDLDGGKSFALARFFTTGGPTAVEEGSVAAPSACVLRAALPNPCRGRTTIAFDLPGTGSVRFAVYDVAGRLVQRLVDEPPGMGAHQTMWDGTDERGRAVAAGVYFARLDAGGWRTRRSIVVLR